MNLMVASLQLLRHTHEMKSMVLNRSQLLVLGLLVCAGHACATATPAPAPASGLEVQPEDFCIGFGTNHTAVACLGNQALYCLGLSAATEEMGYLLCFVGGSLMEQCLAGPPQLQVEETNCIGVDISDERLMCFGQVGWSCQGSSFGYPGFMACFVSGSIKCLF